MNGANFSLFVFSLIEASFFAMKNGIFYDFIIICANNMQMKKISLRGWKLKEEVSQVNEKAEKISNESPL